MHGVIVGLLRESHSDRVVGGDSTFLLRAGEWCLYPIGARVQVVYADASGRCEAEQITLVPAYSARADGRVPTAAPGPEGDDPPSRGCPFGL